ncbi:MAG: hypothetical protein AB7S26_32330 [Sandaracinaceae bacterium]
MKIEMDEEATTGRRAPDRDGFVRWAIELAPRARERVKLRYTVRRHSDVSGSI